MSALRKWLGMRDSVAVQTPTPSATGHAWGEGAPRASGDTQETRWRGASRILRGLQSWLPWLGSATSDLPANELHTMRARSRDALRGNMIARAALKRCQTNIVGTGLMCRPSVDHAALGITADEGEALNIQLRAAYERWADDPSECDIERTLDFYGIQSLALLSAMLSGDVFALTPQVRHFGGVAELKVQLIEADRVSNLFDAPDTPSRIQGVEIDGVAPVGYWVRNQHPGDTAQVAGMSAWVYYPAFGNETGRRRVLHIWNDKERPGQVRGAPYLAPILEPLKQIDRYGGAELMAAVVSAMLTVFIEKDKDVYSNNTDAAQPFEGAADAQGNVALGNAAVVDLAVGEKASFVNPLRPNANFDPFFQAIVKQIGAALEIPLDELLLHYQSSYSAARAAMLQAWRFYLTKRWVLTQQLCVPMYGLLIDEEVATGRITLPGYADPIRRRAYTRALWIGPARGAMDEYKEAKAAGERIRIGVSNEAIEAAAMMGEDRADIYVQRLREVKQRRRDGMDTDPAKPLPPDPDDEDTTQTEQVRA